MRGLSAKVLTCLSGRHIIALADLMWQRAGVGGHPLAMPNALTRGRHHPTVIVTLTKDNVLALYFFQRRG
jgi:hypothetical protein